MLFKKDLNLKLQLALLDVIILRPKETDNLMKTLTEHTLRLTDCKNLENNYQD
jgi:hypothetical protein